MKGTQKFATQNLPQEYFGEDVLVTEQVEAISVVIYFDREWKLCT